MLLPQWFINAICDESNKQKAILGLLKGKDVITVKCADCNNQFDIAINSCVKTRNKEDKDHKLKCRSCALKKDDINIGDNFGDLIVIENRNNNKVKCRCACGSEIEVFINNLRSGRTKSCGKHKKKIINQNNYEALYNQSITLFESFLKSINIHYEKNIYNSVFESNLDFILYTTNNRFFINFYGEKTVRCNHKSPKELLLIAESNQERMINIFVNEYLNNTQKINNVIKDIVCSKKKIAARKCLIKEVDKETASSFFNDNHLQGNTFASKINYGLYYNNELYAVMGFGNSNYHSMNTIACNDFFDSSRYELHRYAVKIGFTIIGGFSKLLSFFEREKSPTYILSYSANDWFVGDMYKKMGFNFTGYSAPRYYWIKNNIVLNREQCQLKNLAAKHQILYKESLEKNVKNKENYIMEKLGFVKVSCAGTKKWEKFY